MADFPFSEQPISDDEHSGQMVPREYLGMFEGPEKTLEVCFRRCIDDTTLENDTATTDVQVFSSNNKKVGLRQLSRDELSLICSQARCTILSSISNQYVDAYVLSESSLFVYPYMLVLKTCGTTTLLRCIATLIDLGKKLSLEIDWIGYSRKNFNFPGDQAFPHQSFHQELEYLSSHRKLSKRLDGSGYTLGPVTSDHWFVFVADHTVRKTLNDTDRVLNIMMFDIDPDVANIFYWDNDDDDDDVVEDDTTVKRMSLQQTRRSGIDALCPGAIMDARAFRPCGYSMNALLFHSYSTIHITPEKECSYASFETNQKVTSYRSLINNVVRTFRPKRFVMTLMADEGGLLQIKENPFTDPAATARVVVPGVKKGHQYAYKRSNVASIQVEEDCCCIMGNWTLTDTVVAATAAATNGEAAGAGVSNGQGHMNGAGRARGLSSVS